MSQITDATSNAEAQEILTYYTTDAGINQAQWAQDIQDGTVPFDLIDVITAYSVTFGTFPFAPEAYLADPDSIPEEVWSDEVVNSLLQLGDLYPNLSTQIDNFLQFGSEQGSLDSATILEAERLIAEAASNSESDDETLNLFQAGDLKEVMSAYMAMGNPAIALLLYAAYGLGPATQNLLEKLNDKGEDFISELEDIADEIDSYSADDPQTQILLQSSSNKQQTVSAQLQINIQFMQNVINPLNELIQAASNMSESTSQTNSMVIRNL